MPANMYRLQVPRTGPSQDDLRRGVADLKNTVVRTAQKSRRLEETVRALQLQLEWWGFVLLLADEIPTEQGVVVRRFWLRLQSERMPLPRVSHGDTGTVRFSWSRRDRHLDVEIWPDGSCEWFLSVDGPTRLVEGTENDRESIPTATILARLTEHFSEVGA